MMLELHDEFSGSNLGYSLVVSLVAALRIRQFSKTIRSPLIEISISDPTHCASLKQVEILLLSVSIYKSDLVYGIQLFTTSSGSGTFFDHTYS